MPSRNKKKKKNHVNEEKGGPLMTTCSNGTKSEYLEHHESELNQHQNNKKEDSHQNPSLKFIGEEKTKMSGTSCSKENVDPSGDLVKRERTINTINEMLEARNPSPEQLETNLLITHKHDIIVHKFRKRGRKDADRAYEEIVKLIEKGKIDTVSINSGTLSHPFILYNLAVLYYQYKWYDEAYDIVSKLMHYFTRDDYLSLLLGLLDIAILMGKQKLYHALYHIEMIEERLKPLDKAPVVRNTDADAENAGIKKKKQKRKLFELPSGDFEVSVRLLLQQKKTECLIRTYDLANAKREYKKYLNLNNSVQQSECSPRMKELIASSAVQSHLKTLMEFLTGHPDKALSLITNIAYKENSPLGLCTMTNPDNVQYFTDFGDNLGIILNNNAGCCYQARRQFAVAGWYFRQATFECDNLAYKDKKNLPMHCLSYNLKYEVLYNYGISRLLSKKYYDGFYYLWIVSREAFARNPRVWLHLAECCVQINTQRKREGLTSKESLMAPLKDFRPTCPTTGKILVVPPDCSPPAPTLRYALKCIINALKLVDTSVINKCIGLEVPPCDPVTDVQEIEDLTATILVTGLYIALLRKMFKLVISLYLRLETFRYVHPVYFCLSKQYLAVAIHRLGQQNKCRQVFSDESIKNYTFIRPVDPGEGDVDEPNPYPGPSIVRRGSNQFTVLDAEEEIAARDTFMYNHAIADFKAGDLLSARRMVQVWIANNKKYPRELAPKFEKLLVRIQKRVESVRKQNEKMNETRGTKPNNHHRKPKAKQYRRNEPPKNNRIQELQKR